MPPTRTSPTGTPFSSWRSWENRRIFRESSLSAGRRNSVRSDLHSGAYGHPAVVDVLLEAMAGDDPQSAVAAAATFEKITGIEADARQPNR